MVHSCYIREPELRVTLISKITVIDPDTNCQELRDTAVLHGGMTFTYAFSGTSAQGHQYVVSQGANMASTLKRVPGNQMPGLSTVRQASAAPIFDSSPKGTGSTYVIRLSVAGTYAYADHLHASHKGTTTVPMTVSPESGPETTSFVVTWATGADPVVSGGWAIDVQVATPGAADFVSWQDGATTTSGTYIPNAGKGLYRFRTRLRHATAPGASDWSPVASVTVR